VTTSPSLLRRWLRSFNHWKINQSIRCQGYEDSWGDIGAIRPHCVQPEIMFNKLWAKVDHQEALLGRVVGFGQTLKDITYIQTETACDVKLLLGEIDLGDEDVQCEAQKERIRAGPETLGPAEITEHLISRPETLERDDMEQVAQGPTMGETSAAPIIPPSPNVTMTTFNKQLPLSPRLVTTSPL
jgi:hypothetical protein